jgi:hypothetical protein
MSEINPPLVLQNAGHASNLVRQLWGDTYTPGVMGSDHLEVTEQSTPDLGVTVAAGRVVIAGTESASQGVYYASNDDDVDVALATADATNDRIDLIVARVLDSFYSGGDDEWELQAVTGTAAASPSAPAAPANSLVLAEVLVPSDPGGNPAITDGDITDMRTLATLRQGAPSQVVEATTQSGITSTSFAAGSPVCGLAFVAPPSGKVKMVVSGFIDITLSANVQRRTELAWELREGSSIGSGTEVLAAAAARSVSTAIGSTSGLSTQVVASNEYLVEGLVGGASYNVRTMHRVNGTTCTGIVVDRRLLVDPVF